MFMSLGAIALTCAHRNRLLRARALVLIALLPPLEVPWRSGHAPDCKSVYPGSIPGGTSTFPQQNRISFFGVFKLTSDQ